MIKNMVFPNEIKKVLEAENYGQFIVEPLERGYGTTLGNTFRRVLLSSVGGFAFTKVKIFGVDSEFSPISSVREDALNLILNLRNVIFRTDMADIEAETVSIDHKEGTVYARDFSCENLVVVNSDSYVATVEEGGRLKLSGVVEYGSGFRKADLVIANREPGWIPVDSDFSSVENVAFHIEHSEIKGFLGYEKLLIDVTTNGTVTPYDSLKDAIAIIGEHLDRIQGGNVSPATAEAQEDDSILEKSIDELVLSVRASNCLKDNKIEIIGDLIKKSESDLLERKNFGSKSLEEIKKSLGKYNLFLKSNEKTDR